MRQIGAYGILAPAIMVGLLVMRPSAAAETNPEVFPKESVAAGVPAPKREDCEAKGNAVWTEVDGKGDCIRYWSAGLESDAPAAVFYIHGDRIWENKTVSYDDNNSGALTKYAEDAAASLKSAFVWLARPGTYGSSGSHADRRQPRELELVRSAMRTIIDRYRIKRFGITGQSGGGSVAAYLMANFPEAKCIALTSSALSLGGLKKAGQTAGYDYGGKDIYDPISHLSEMKPDKERRIFVIGDEKDQYALFPNQVEYFEAAKKAGHDVTLIRSEGARHHSLDVTGQHVVSWCLQGIPTSEIERKIEAKEVRY